MARKPKTLRVIRPNAGIASEYQKKINSLIDEMARSYAWHIRAQYRAKPPEMAQDASPAKALEAVLKWLGRYWEKKINAAAPKLAAWFARKAGNRSDEALRKILRDGGISVKFQMTSAMTDNIDAIVAENVALIKSIPQEFHTQVNGMVMRSVTAGRDLHSLTTELQDRLGVTRRRAEFIASDQNSKATSNLRRVREIELGLDEAIWIHSHAGKVPRPTHVANDGKKFSLKDGWLDPAINKRIWPGTEPRCRCSWRPLIKGFS
jgi:SPP1 gp7 family putative phage head morphogenesis protein